MKAITVKDLAKIHKVSLNTINKALTGRSGISEELRQKILKTAKKIGYRTNKIAQSLARKPIVIGVILPKAWNEFYGYMIKGLNKTFDELADYNVHSRFCWVSDMHSEKETLEAIKSLENAKVNGIILSPLFDIDYEKYLLELKEKLISVVLLDSDIKSSLPLASVMIKSFLSGKLASELMNYLVPEKKDVAVFLGKKNFFDHQEKLSGFTEGSAHNAYNICRVLEAEDDPVLAYRFTEKLLKEHPDLKGIYIATANSVSICECVVKHGFAGKIKIIATDVFPALKPYVEQNIVQFVIYQDQPKQAETAVRILYEYITAKKKCERNVSILPQVVLKNSFGNYLASLESREESYE